MQEQNQELECKCVSNARNWKGNTWVARGLEKEMCANSVRNIKGNMQIMPRAK